MNMKQTTALIAIAILVVAGIGAAYAFNASLDNENNSASIEYWELSITDTSAPGWPQSSDNKYSLALNQATPYDTETVWTGTEERYDMKWVGTLDEDIQDLQLNPLGFLTVMAVQKDHTTPVPDYPNEHYVMTLTMSNAKTHTVNETYDFYAGEVTIVNHKVSVQADKLYPFVVSGVAGKEVFTATVPVTGIGTGYSFAVYAMPHALTTLQSVTDEDLSEDAGKAKTDLLQSAVLTVSVNSERQSDTQEVTSIDIFREMDKKTYDSSVDTDWDLSGLSVSATYADGTVRIIDHADLQLTGFQQGVTEITVTYEGKTAQITGIVVS